MAAEYSRGGADVHRSRALIESNEDKELGGAGAKQRWKRAIRKEGKG